MAKVDKKKIASAFSKIEKQYGKGSIYSIDDAASNFTCPKWSTGLEDLDHILGGAEDPGQGGMPYGRIVEISGAEGSGKTTLAYHLMAQHEVAVDIPAEGTFDMKRAKVFGNQKGQLFVQNVEWAEQALEILLEYAEAQVPVVVLDSLPFLMTKAEYQETDFEKQTQRAQLASLLSRKLSKIEKVLERTQTTWIVINQLRDKQNAMLFGKKTYTPGGRAIKHAYSVRLEVARTDWIHVPNKDVRISAAKVPIGFYMKVKVEKSKVCVPLGECMLAVIFDRGFVPVDDVAEIRKQIMKENNERMKKQGNLKKLAGKTKKTKLEDLEYVDEDEEDNDDE